MLAALCLATAPAHADEPALPIERLVQQITAQVVQVVAGGTEGGASYGSAVLVDARRAVTSCHVVGPAKDVFIVLGGLPQPATLLAADRFHDLCLLALPDGFQRAAPVCRPSAQVATGDLSYAVGFASGRLGFSRGKVQARYAFEGGHVLRTGAGFLPGASGGGLFDDRGRLVGVLTFIRRGGATPAYLAVPCEWVAALTTGTGRDGAATAVDARPDAPPVPFWQLIDQGSAAAPRFMQALQLEAEERWPELQALADRWLADAPGDEGATAMRDLARQRLAPTVPVAPPGASKPTPSPVSSATPVPAPTLPAAPSRPPEPVRTADAPATLTQQDDAQCQSNGGLLVSVQRLAATGDGRVLRVWVERWHLGFKTADRTRHLLGAAGASAPLGCSRTVDGAQHWEIVEMRYVEP